MKQNDYVKYLKRYKSDSRIPRKKKRRVRRNRVPKIEGNFGLKIN